MISAAGPHAGSTLGGMTLRALRRFPDRVAFSWPGGELSYAGVAELMGQYQKGASGDARIRACVAGSPTTTTTT